ncbi:hypothetical protein [Desulfurococcus amylolyticus]|uniref:hypothetical protein n=1 Tax=Desulfurococcus TaxID=2273 RepID=UPI0005B20106|nr:hypothetical protein [Desulfurococcus amylolyticus]
MNPVFETVSKEISILVNRLRDLKVPEYRISRIEEMIKALNSTRTPQIVARDLFNTYAGFISLVKELESGLDKGVDELEIYVFLDKIEEKLAEFINITRKSYVREKIQLSLPLLMTTISFALFILIDPVIPDIISLGFSILGMSIFYFNSTLGLLSVVANIVLNIMLSLYLNELRLDILFLEVIIAFSAVLHIYIIRESSSVGYIDQVVKSLKAVDTLVASYIKPMDVSAVASLLSTIQSHYSTDKIAELFRYKAVVMLMNGYSIEEVEKSLFRASPEKQIT